MQPSNKTEVLQHREPTTIPVYPDYNPLCSVAGKHYSRKERHACHRHENCPVLKKKKETPDILWVFMTMLSKTFDQLIFVKFITLFPLGSKSDPAAGLQEVATNAISKCKGHFRTDQ